MHTLRCLISRSREMRGQGMAEYALILALVAIVAMAALTPLGSNIKTALNSVASAL
jgi:pilus assembly protein Flp/PilA